MNLKSDYSAEIHLYNDSSLHNELRDNQVGDRLHDNEANVDSGRMMGLWSHYPAGIDIIFLRRFRALGQRAGWLF